ncbi:MAG: TRAP transporter small permease subunit [Gammaproteobacteria bacterium]|nr:TRAP transporter small permease subunit [Gammaproteobacteria bacterium]
MSPITEYALRLKNILVRIEKIIAGTSLLLLLAFTIIQVVARNLFDTGFPELDIISRHLVLFIAFMGAALVSETNKHIKIDILVAFLSFRQKQILFRPLLIASAIVCLLFAWLSTQFWTAEWDYSTAHERWTVLLALILPAGFITISLHFILLSITGISPDYKHTET